jgi:hypothetical protein
MKLLTDQISWTSLSTTHVSMPTSVHRERSSRNLGSDKGGRNVENVDRRGRVLGASSLGGMTGVLPG